MTDHHVSLHFRVNDVLVCFFIGLDVTEGTEALPPSGSRSPLRRTANPLMATVGVILGPIALGFDMVLVLGAAGFCDNLQCQSASASRAVTDG